MPAKHNYIVSKTKTMVCGHKQTFFTPVPQRGEDVWCLTCEKPSSIPKQPRGRWSVAEGRPRRLKANPKSNNQYTKGRKLNE